MRDCTIVWIDGRTQRRRTMHFRCFTAGRIALIKSCSYKTTFPLQHFPPLPFITLPCFPRRSTQSLNRTADPSLFLEGRLYESVSTFRALDEQKYPAALHNVSRNEILLSFFKSWLLQCLPLMSGTLSRISTRFGAFYVVL